ncbi:MAG: TIGR03013 family PEP-CTERM/XrtA system glycosyltransferase [Acidobacteriaceae bacterium]|nr:TIGR03013 family PEP-CTERM/XrtA system glycosyltransferase [Acidobacteriaceae bacterium]
MIRVFDLYLSPRGALRMAVEASLMTIGLVCAAKVHFWNNPAAFASFVSSTNFYLLLLAFLISFQSSLLFFEQGGSTPHRGALSAQVGSIGLPLCAGCLLLTTFWYWIPVPFTAHHFLFISAGLCVALVAPSRMAFDAVWRRAIPAETVVILGCGPLARSVAQHMLRRNDLPVNLAGFIDAGNEPAMRLSSIAGKPVLGNLHMLDRVVAEHRVKRIVVALEDRRGVLPLRELVHLRVGGVRIDDHQSAMVALTGRVSLEAIASGWLVFSSGFTRSQAVLRAKRFMDVVLAACGLMLLSPLMLLVAVAIRLESKGAVIYRQQRVGLRGSTFEILKFRSMRADAEAGGRAVWAQKGDPRVTRAGRVLRKYRIDEIPQLLNVLRGQMSLVGPRPERPVFVEQLRAEIPFYDERHSIRPGLTGWAQVQSGYGASVEDTMTKLEYDLFYAKNLSLGFDLLIALKTIRTVLTGSGAH